MRTIALSFLLAVTFSLLLPAGLLGAGVREPVLVPLYPWGSEYASEFQLLVHPSVTWRVVESYRRGLLGWRLFHGAYPVSTQRAAPVSLLAGRSIEWSLQEAWLTMNRENSLRTARDRTSLVPTIYLPLDMPPILAGAIGEGGQLDISGQQKITLSGISHYRPNAVQTEGESQSLFPDLKMEQELRVQLQGTIGDKIHVDVDHDSERNFGPQSSLSLRYEGYDDEVIQSIEMGDVSLSITGPEFVSYSIPSQGLFGAKILAQVGPVEITTIASRESGSTESAEFVGQATMVEDTILDINPADNYFFLVFPDTAPQPNLSSIRVFQDDLDGTNNQETGAVEAAWFVEGGETGNGWWDELLPGEDLDFVLEDSARIIRFTSPMNDNYRIAVWAVTAQGDTIGSIPAGGDWNLKMIKSSNPLPDDPTWPYELRNRYFLGANNIVQETFNCDIYLERSGEDPIPTQGGTPFIELLGLDTNGDGNLSDEEEAVDWDNGFLVFPQNRPFIDPVLEVTNPTVYNDNNPLPVDSKYFLAVSYRAASTTYSLGRMGIIPGSEKVTLTVAGSTTTLVKDVDYTIIYEIGLLTLMGEAAEAAQNPSNTLRVSFEYLPLFASQKKTLIGTRAVYGLGRDSWVGATMMFQSASTPGDRPRVGEESTRTFVADIDAHLETKPDFLTDFANLIPGINTEAESRAAISGEIAMSFPNPNVDGRAYVDDMEGTETTFPLGQSRASWHYSGQPDPIAPAGSAVGEMRWYNTYRRWRLEDIVPSVTEQEADDYVNNVLEFYFQPDSVAGPFSWGGVQRCIDKYGLDFTNKTHIRLYVRATGSAQSGHIYLDLGERMDEDSYWLERVAGQLMIRANGELDTEDVNSDGILSDDEDTGLDNLWDDEENPPQTGDPNRDNYYYDNDDPPSERYDHINGTQGNNNLDTEDLNRNGVLDRSNSFFRMRIPVDDPEYIISGPNQEGWMLIEIPLDDTTLVDVPPFITGSPTWEKISYARIWMTGFTEADTVQVYDLEVVGNRWEEKGVLLADSIGTPVLSSEQFYVSTVNNKDNPAYAANPPPGVDPGEDEYGEPRMEQSISLRAENIQGGHYGLATQSYYAGEDYTGYREIRFLVHGQEDLDGQLIYRLGSDSLNYYEIDADIVQGWQTVEVPMEDLVDLKARKQDEGLQYIREGDLAVRGNPNFASIMQMSLGIRNDSPLPMNTTVWVDDITLHQPWANSGTAHRVSGNLEIADLLDLSGDYREMDSDFHGLGSRRGQGYTSIKYSAGATMYLNRFTPPLWSIYAPANYSWTLDISKPVFQSGSDYRLSNDESWDQRTQLRHWSTGFQLRKNSSSDDWPGRYFIDPFRLTHTYSRGYGQSPVYRDTSSTADGSLSYNLNLGSMRLLRLPVIEYLRLRPTSISWSLGRRNSWDTRWSFVGEDTVQTRATVQRTLSPSGSIAFNPWKGLSASGSLGLVRDMLYPWEGGLGVNVGREVSRNQSVSVSQEVNLFDYLVPRVSFDSHYSQSRLAPHTGTQADSLGLPRYSVSVNRRLNLRVGLVHTIRSLARLRDERLDEEAEPGSPRWFLIKLERWANMINDPTISYTETEGSEYRDMGFLPDWNYRLGLDPTLDDVLPWDRNKGWNLQVSGGFRPVSTMSVRLEYRSSENRNLYSGFWNNTRSKTWPSVSFSWSGLNRLAGLSDLMRTGSLSSGYSIETTESGRYEDDIYTPTNETRKTSWTPLFNINVTLNNDVQITLTDNLSNTEMRSFTGTQARTESSSNSLQFKIQYAFSAPGGIAIPLPLLDRLRVSFQSDLTTSLSVSRTRTRSELFGSLVGQQLQQDREEWRIEPAVNYDFGTVVAGLTGIYGWKTDRVNSQFDQRDVGMNIWVTINF